MTISAYSAVVDGAEALLVEAQACYGSGFSGVQLLGNSTEVVRQGLERARAALANSGVKVPHKKIIISLLPGDVRKNGNQLDLVFAALLMSLELAAQDKPFRNISNWLLAAEIGLDGSLQPVSGMISFGLQAKLHQLDGIIVAKENLRELEILAEISGEFHNNDLKILGFEQVADFYTFIQGGDLSGSDTVQNLKRLDISAQQQLKCFDDMHLSEDLELLAQCVAVGHHSLLLSGAPGVGKSMFAERLPSIFPRIDGQLHLQTLMAHSLSHKKIDHALLWGVPPFRQPHHNASSAAILGGTELPGELALAHGGILFLDEFPEFRRDVTEGLREPLETGVVRIVRAQRSHKWLCELSLIAAQNNCPCGWFGSHRRTCQCTTQKIQAYRRRISGPIMDRFDLHFHMPEADSQRTVFGLSKPTASKSKQMHSRVVDAYQFGQERLKKLGVYSQNRSLSGRELVIASGLEESQLQEALASIMSKKTTNRTMLRTIRVARSLADLEFKESIGEANLKRAWSWQAEAVSIQRGDHSYGLA